MKNHIRANLRETRTPVAALAARLSISILLCAPIAGPTTLSGAEICSWKTIAGVVGTKGSADATNAASLFNNPGLIASEGATNLYVGDILNSTIRKLTKTEWGWVTTTIAGAPKQFGSADGTNNTARFFQPSGITVDASGVLYVVEHGNNGVRKIAPIGTNWVVTTIAGTAGTSGSADGTNGTARFYQPQGIAVDTNGNLYVSDSFNYTIRKLMPIGTNWVVSTIAGKAGAKAVTDGTNEVARFSFPVGVAVDPVGDVYVADMNAYGLRRISQIGTNWVVSSIPGVARPGAVAVDSNGDIYVTEHFNHTIRRLRKAGTNWSILTVGGLSGRSGASDGTNSAAQFYQPIGLAASGEGHVYVADTFNQTIRLGTFVPLIQEWNLTNGIVKFAWSTVPGLEYQVQYSTNLSENIWSDFAAPEAATGETLTVSQVVAGTNTHRVYRVIQKSSKAESKARS